MGSRAAGGGREGRGGGGERGGRGRDRENSERGSGGGEAMEQNLRPEGPAGAALLPLKTIFEMFELCVHGSLSRTRSHPGSAAPEGRGEATPRAALPQARVSAALRAARPPRRPGPRRGRRGPPGVPGRAGPWRRLSGVCGACSLASSPPPRCSPRRSLPRPRSPGSPPAARSPGDARGGLPG